MRIKRHNKARVVAVPYGTTIEFAPGSGDVTLVVGELTGNLALNIVDPFAEDGDILKVAFAADGTERTVTLGGAQGAAGTVVIAIDGVASLFLLYSSVAGNYNSVVVPT